MDFRSDNATSDDSINGYFSKLHGTCSGYTNLQPAEKAQQGIAFASQFVVPLAITQLLYPLLRRRAQPFFAFEILAVLVISLLRPLLIHLTNDDDSTNAVVVHGSIIMGFNMGLDMHLSSFWTTDAHALAIAASTTLTTFLLSFGTAYLLREARRG